MHTLIALLVAAASTCALARPPGPTATPMPMLALSGQRNEHAPESPAHGYLREYLLSRYLLPHFLGFEESPRVPPISPIMLEHDWLNKEIDRINQMEENDDTISPYETDLTRWIVQEPYLQRMFQVPINMHEPQVYAKETPKYDLEDIRSAPEPVLPKLPQPQREIKRRPVLSQLKVSDEQKRNFALTPLDKGYYDHEAKQTSNPSSLVEVPVENEEPKPAMLLEPPRRIRQNPNLSRTKTLVAENLDRLRTGLANKDYRLPVSLLPTNLGWLKLNHPVEVEESSQEDGDATDKPRHIHILETAAPDPAESIYGVALVAAVGAALTIAIFGFAFGWYTLSKKAKAAADVDYPAYGVTGPTIDTSGDRKLAHSAHMYHYQHQKQQIIAMERNGLEQRNGSVSDPESEEENEEGDYTVYECPGFATTGDMEVKNPLFSDDPTPATPGKCEMVKPQPKD